MITPDYTPEEKEMYRRQAIEFAARATPSENQNTTTYGNNVLNESTQYSNNNTDYDEFLREHPGRGSLRVQVSFAEGNFPLDRTMVEVAKNYNGKRYIVYKNLTDSSGILDNLVLPARPMILSQREATASESGTDYLVSVSHPNFSGKSDIVITVFDKIKTVLPITLLPEMR